MTKRHFIALADAIRGNRVAFSVMAIAVMADFCKSQNPNFNYDRWLNYIEGKCGPNGGRK